MKTAKDYAGALSNPDRAFAVARRIGARTVAHNAFVIDFSVEFGGFKQSWIGREVGRDRLRGYLETKTVLLKTEANDAV